jgi:hypothetical protein
MSFIIQECWCAFPEDFICEDGLYKYMPSICVWGESPRYVLDGKLIYEFGNHAEPIPQTFWGVDSEQCKAFRACFDLCEFANFMAGLDYLAMYKITYVASIAMSKK